MDSEDDIPRLSGTTLSALQEFYAERALHEEKFNNLLEETKGAEISAINSSHGLAMDLFAEDWQQSQFWYTDDTARTLATALIANTTKEETIAMVSAPSVYVMAKNLLKEFGRPPNEWPRILLLEFDRRFEVFKEDFVFYDFKNPLRLPPELKGNVNHILCDPPFLSEDCQAREATTVRWLSKSWGLGREPNAKESRLIICTGERMEETITKLYQKQGVARTNFEPAHSKHQLSNEFLCYANFECDHWTWPERIDRQEEP